MNVMTAGEKRRHAQECCFDPMVRHDCLVRRTADDGLVVLNFQDRKDKLIRRSITSPAHPAGGAEEAAV